MRLMLGKFIFFFYLSGHHRDLHSFPTRRSSDLANALENDILGHEAWLQLSFEPEMHRFGHLQQQFACAHHKAGICVANARGEFVERAGHAGVRIGAKQNLAWTRVALLWQRGVTDTREIRSVLAL